MPLNISDSPNEVLPIPSRIAEFFEILRKYSQRNGTTSRRTNGPLISTAGGFDQPRKFTAEDPPRPLPLHTSQTLAGPPTVHYRTEAKMPAYRQALLEGPVPHLRELASKV